jgi:hypothetical protein
MTKKDIGDDLLCVGFLESNNKVALRIDVVPDSSHVVDSKSWLRAWRRSRVEQRELKKKGRWGGERNETKERVNAIWDSRLVRVAVRQLPTKEKGSTYLPAATSHTLHSR